MSYPFQVVHEDNHLLIVNKESGILVQEDETGDMSLEEMVKDYIKVKYQKPGSVFCGVVHRLDRPVSGLVILARTSKALERMNKMFQERRIQKTYWALVGERPPQDEAVLTHWLVKDHDKNMSKAYDDERRGGVLAELSYKMVARAGRYYLLEVKPVTGRPHQIRVQLAKIGCPIKGDVKYGFPEKNKDGSIHLHARSLEFIHPVKNDPISCSARLPNEVTWREFENLRF